MNPLKSLMALGAFLLVAPALAHADDWIEIHTQTQSYFVNQKDSEAFQKLKKGPWNGPVPLWVEEGTPAGPQKVESQAALGCSVSKPAKKGDKGVRSCHINVNAKGGGSYRVGVKIGENQPPIQPATQQAADQRPAGVPQEVWAAVVNSSVPQAQWERAAALANKVLLSTQGKAAGKLHGAGKVDYDKVLAQISQDITAGKDDDSIVKNAIDLSETLPMPKVPKTVQPPAGAGGDADKTGGDGKGSGTDDDKNVLNTLAAQLSNKPVQADFTARLTAYLTSPTGPNAFISPTAKPKELSDDDFKKQFAGQVAVFVTSATESAGQRGRAAVLYYMIGEKEKPWFAGHPELNALSRDAEVRKYFDLKMAPFTVAGGAPYGGDGEWVPATLTKALGLAESAWTDKRVKGKVKDSVDAGDQGLQVPGSIGKGTDLKSLMARAFNMKDMYESGAQVTQLQIPGSDPAKYRKISIKMYSETYEWGPPQKVRDQIGIFDISEPGDARTPSNIFGQFFPINQRGELNFALDDRVGGQLKYTLTMDQGKMTFAMNDKKDKAPDPKKPSDSRMETSLNDLYDLRNKQVANNEQSYTASIAGTNYRVIPQGGPLGTLLYYPLGKDGTIGDSPSMSVALTEIGPSGKTQNIKGPRDLGYVGNDASGNPQFYQLAWNADRGVYEAVKVDKPAGNPPGYTPPAKSPTTDTGKVTPDQTGGNTADNTDNTDQTTQDPGSKLEPTKLSACKYGKFFGVAPDATPGKDANQLYRDADGWKLYTQATGDVKDTNNTYLCVYSQLGIFIPGIIGKDKASLIGDDGGFLHILAVTQAAAPDQGEDSGHKFLKPNQLPGVYVKGDKLAFKKGDQEVIFRNIDQGTEYYIPLAGLEDSIKAGKSLMIANVTKVAWVAKDRNFATTAPNPALTVYVHPKDDALAVITKAINELANDGPCATVDHTVSPKMTEYLQAAVKDPELAKKLGSFDTGDANSVPPNIVLMCRAQSTGTAGDWTLAVPSWNKDRQLAAKAGVIDETSGYWAK